tara:strand:- start:65 stop:238 length:174 start_codon:yes stop_codon:yes gene_type:complete
MEAASPPQAGKDEIAEMMEKAGLPMDRETYLKIAFFGEAPEELSAEQEADIPEMFKV